MQIAEAQQDMVRAYTGGAPGVLVSGLVWLAAGLVWSGFGLPTAFAVLFVGGMAIMPTATAISRLMFRSGAAAKGNPLNRLGIESAAALMGGVLIGYVLLSAAPPFAIPAFAVVIGTRYFAFRTLYGEWLYWLLGGTIAALGMMALLRVTLAPANLAVLVGVTELLFAAVLLWRYKRRPA